MPSPSMENSPEIPPPLLVRSSESIWRLVLLLALPVLAQQGLYLVVNLSDRFLAGHLKILTPDQHQQYLGHQIFLLGNLGANVSGEGLVGRVAAAEIFWEEGRKITGRQAAYQSAQTTANYLAWFIVSYTVLVTVGSTALVARFWGAGNRELANRVTHQSFLLAVFLGLLATLLALGGGLNYLVFLMQLRGEAAQFAYDYLFPLFLLMVFQMVQAAGTACLVGVGDTRTGLWVMIGVALVNIPLAWGFCRGLGPFPELGFVGIAVGTAVSHFLGGVAILVLLMRGRSGLHLTRRLLIPDLNLLWRLLRIGLPAGLDSLSVVVGQFWFLSIVNRLGDHASSAHGIALQWEALGYLSGAAFGTAAMTLVGQNLGAGQPTNAARAGWVACGLGGLTMSFMGLIFFILAELMFKVFCPNPWQSPIVELGVPVLRLVAFAMPPLASTIIFTSALRGAGDTRVPVLFTWIGFFVVRIPLAYLLIFPQVHLGPLGVFPGADLGLFGAWLAMVADIVVRGSFFLHRFARGSWQKTTV